MSTIYSRQSSDLFKRPKLFVGDVENTLFLWRIFRFRYRNAMNLILWVKQDLGVKGICRHGICFCCVIRHERKNTIPSRKAFSFT